MTAQANDPRTLLGLSPLSDRLVAYLRHLASLTPSGVTPAPEVKCYPDALYTNYHSLGLSLMFIAKDRSKPISKDDLHGDKLELDSIIIYATDANAKGRAHSAASPGGTTSFATYPVSTLRLPLSKEGDKARPAELALSQSSTGKDFVGTLGEPDRKGGGAGPSSGSIGIWCEWPKDGIMVEFGGDEARGPQAWERGKDAKWKMLTLFRPKSS